jgi:hypothetical protein
MSECNDVGDGTWDLPAEPDPGLSRRRFLETSAGGFVVAAGGLLLPEVLVEAAANSPVQRVRHHAGQRRHKRRHQRQHHRKQRRQGNGSSRGGGAGDPHIRWISYVVYNDRPVTTPNQSVSIVSWARDTSSNDGPWHAGASFRLFNGVNDTFSRQVSNAAIEIDGRYLVDAENFIIFAPLVSIDHGGTMTRLGYQGGTEAQSSRLSENEQIEADIDGHHFRVKRIADTDDYKVFEVHLT